ncbi:MAG TPA: SIS domain-containing protein [Chloroflexia bacterium]|nr:SIS domain-containing protein [Chloroflexia bacterium]
MPQMRLEILQQPGVLERAMRQARPAVELIAQRVRVFEPEAIVIVARGSSDHAAVYAQYLLQSYTGKLVSLATPSLFTHYHRPPDLSRTWVTGISQSGRTADVVEVVRQAREMGALTLGLANAEDSALARTAEYFLPLNVGPELSIATKTYSAELALMALLTAELSGDAGLKEGLSRLPEVMQKALELEEPVKSLAELPSYRNIKACLVIGRGFNLATTLELAMKIRESCYFFADPYSAEDFMHGPVALAEKGLPALMIGTKGPTMPGLLQLAERLTALGVELATISDDDDLLKWAASEKHDIRLDLEDLPEALSPLITCVPCQFFPMYLSLARGTNPDMPRNLRENRFKQ